MNSTENRWRGVVVDKMKIDTLMRVWGLDPKLEDEALEKCPHCGKLPKLKVTEHYGILGVRYECRRWFGLRLCAHGPLRLEEHSEEAYFEKVARAAWNDAVRAFVAVRDHKEKK